MKGIEIQVAKMKGKKKKDSEESERWCWSVKISLRWETVVVWVRWVGFSGTVGGGLA